jgi:hypothetical protein
MTKRRYSCIPNPRKYCRRWYGGFRSAAQRGASVSPSRPRAGACDTCKTYLKAIDLTKDGHAVPIVDEIATVALNIWAEERDYMKLETNLLGM